jgi:hypothetical protein
VFEHKTFTRQFDMENTKDRDEYSRIIDDPLCSILSTIKEKLTEKAMGDDGEPSYIKERIVLIVTWQEKRLMEDF